MARSESLMEQILTLNVSERIRLASDIWETISDEQMLPPMDPALQAEIERRVAQWRKNPEGGISLEEWERETFGDP